MNPTIGELSHSPGAYIAEIRRQKGYTLEYVAAKLYLRVQMIELLESDNYAKMPEPVFIKGYLRAYARLLEIDSAPLLAVFNAQVQEYKTDRTLWQIKRESNHAERLSRWFSTVVLISIVAVALLWWQKDFFKQNSAIAFEQTTASRPAQTSSALKLTDIAQVQTILAIPSNATLIKTDSNGKNSSN